VGYADVTQANIGAQLGAQKFAELILFENQRSLLDFQDSTTTFDARATAVAAASGAAAVADYTRGVIVFTMPESGLMAQAAIGGQKFRYVPLGS
jgi:lipid-binding SYLF domain-containing protein